MNKRNAFVALCDYASKNNWCWKIVCTTCGHDSFRVGFSKIIRGQHPDDDFFWPNGKEDSIFYKEIKDYKEFKFKTFDADQLKLATLVADAKLSDIQAIVKFPNWLGFIGLVIFHCSSTESRKILSDSFLPQFIHFVKNDREICEYLKEKQKKSEFLSVNDLSRIETKNVNLKNLPYH